MAVTKIWKVVKRMDHVIGYAKDENKTKIEFNQKYEAYNKKALRGTDIITLKNMAKSEENAVNLIVTDINGTTNINVDLNTNKTAIFACTNVEYSNGRITALSFQKIKD